MYQDYLLEKLDDIERVIAQKKWVKSYHIFLQSFKEKRLRTYEEEIQNSEDTTNMGCSVQILSTNQVLFERTISISDVNRLKLLKPPKSTREKANLDQFPKLNQPNTTSIPGDFSNSIDMESVPNFEILNKGFDKSSQYEIPFYHTSSLNLETRVITSDGSTRLTENSLRVNYETSTRFDVRDISYILSRSIAGRSLDLDIEKPILELVNATITRIKSPMENLPDDTAILFHPEVIGRIMTSYFAKTNWNRVLGKNILSSDLNLYDDPTKSGGYYSTLFDDEGQLARPKQILDEGRVVSQLNDMRSSNWKEGGSGYRVDWYQPQTRAYNYRIRPAGTNLILNGGAGKGKYFTERPGKVILVRKGATLPGVSSKASDFILHVHESELYDDGDLLGPVGNFTLSGNFETMLNKGHLSNDPGKMTDQSIPLTFYGGWLIVPSSTVNLRS